MRLKALDLYCGAGGATKGLQRAGFHVTGVDIKEQPNYCGDAFLQSDALYCGLPFSSYDFLWASPPCQAYSDLKHVHKNDHPELIEPTRRLLKESGRPYCIENVEGAPLINPIKLCGTSFGLQTKINGVLYELRRHRIFECSFFIMGPPCNHRLPVVGIYGSGEAKKILGKRGFQISSLHHRRALMDMEWASRAEISQAIPPPYSEFIGRAAARFIEGAA